MKKIILLLLLCDVAFAAINGTDDRHEVLDAPTHIQEVSNSIAALVRKKNVIKLDDGNYKLAGSSYVDALNFCPDARFVQTQTLVANCSAFLIAPNLIGTAGHCVEGIRNELELDQYYAVFDYKVTKDNQSEFIISKESLFELKTAKQFVFEHMGDKDVAILELDRVVKGRTPLKLANSRVQKDDSLYILGFPLGLAMKYQDNGFVTATNDSRGGMDSFVHTLDTFSVNSGSAIFSAETDEIVGILVRGIGPNMDKDEARNCNVWGGEISSGGYVGEGNYIDLLEI